MIVIHFNSLGKQVGVRLEDDVNPPPAEGVTKVTLDETTNIVIVAVLKNDPLGLRYVDGVLSYKGNVLPINTPSPESLVKSAIKGKVAGKLLDLRNGTAVFDADMQRALYFVLTRLMEKIK